MFRLGFARRVGVMASSCWHRRACVREPTRRVAAGPSSLPVAALATRTTTTSSTTNSSFSNKASSPSQRLSKVLSTACNLTLSRREAERLIRSGQVTLAGQVVNQPHLLVSAEQIKTLRLQGKVVQATENDPITKNSNNSTSLENATRVWLVHKLPGELVADFDPLQRPLLMERLKRGGVGRDAHNSKRKWHLKPVGRLDLSTEGLMVVTNDGAYARAMELPAQQLHRMYRVRVHGILHAYKLTRMERGMIIDGIRYRGMKVDVEKARRSKASSTNQWITLTCTEGKNRQVRNVLKYLGLKVTRLIRTGYGDYQLQTIPPGMAIEVPVKPVEKQKNRGPLWKSKPSNKKRRETSSEEEQEAPPIQWVRRF